MNYKKNSLYIENISIQRIAKKFGTPEKGMYLRH